MKKNLKRTAIDGFDPLTFISIGLSCHAFCLIEYAGILEILKKSGKFPESLVQTYKNPSLVRSALSTLVSSKILKLVKGIYSLTRRGESLEKNIGILMLPFVGYRKLLSKQFHLLNNPNEWEESEIDFSSVAVSSISFGLQNLDPIILEIFKSLKPKGTICDLGCGTGEKLIKICKATNSRGIGIEKNIEVIKESKKFIGNKSNIKIIQGDFTKLDGIWEDVESLMLSFVYHDIKTSKQCLTFLQSLKMHFSNFQHLIIIDIISPSEKVSSIMPGFDYVHGLQGFTPRTYEETIETFSQAKLKIFKEIPIPNMPNTFLWAMKSV